VTTEFAYGEGDDAVIAMFRNGAAYHFLRDRLGSTVAVTDSA
jgi:hypothetical protein